MIPRLAPAGKTAGMQHAGWAAVSRSACQAGQGTRHQPFGRDCCQYCCHDGRQHLPRMDNRGMSAQRMDRSGRSWTTCLFLRISPWYRWRGAVPA
jgi:hypothetical protein